jgi:hypothetical protein
MESKSSNETIALKLLLPLIGFAFLIALLNFNNASAQTSEEFDGTITKKEDKPYSRGGTGAFGTQLSKKASFVSINGAADMEFDYNKKDSASTSVSNSTFAQEQVDLFVSAQLSDKISTEFNVEFEDGGTTIDIDYAFFDYKFSEKAVFRIGKFFLPTGDFNEYTHQTFIHKAVDDPLSTAVSPSSWSDTGIQLRGKFGTDTDKLRPYYAVYLVNGLQGRSGDQMEILENGKFNDNNNSKALGAQAGIEYKRNLFTSISYHQSTYDSASELSSKITGFSAGYDDGKIYLAGEYHNNNLDIDPTTTNSLTGFYVLSAYKLKRIEPIFRYDQNNIAGVQASRFTYGLNYYLIASGFVKLSYEEEKRGDITISEFNAALVFTF